MLLGVLGLPPPVQRATMPLWAGIFYGLVPEARRAVERNLRRVLGARSRRRLHADSFRLFVNYAQSLTDLYALHLGARAPEGDARCEGGDRIRAALAPGRGAIFATGHLGWWPLAPFLLDAHGLPVPTLAMAEEPSRALQAFEERLRRRWRIVYTTRSPFASLPLLAALRRGELIAMQIDRHLGGPRVAVPFFGQPAPFAAGPATLARATGAPILPSFLVREGRRLHATVEEPIVVERTADRDADVRAATARLAEVYASYVRRHPLQWFTFYDFWSDETPHDVAT
jgi:KDO2-lipid IV(A) lauroyltransferase